ncbi:MAG: DUF4922 domain-containing protein [Bacteroidales bacterium]|nr:DUF4922 domain-containing protein [Bacteroidales bacterium]MCF8391151.1 DUF4922 domain-containing protein [Bacteroidales bacterium]
MEYDKKILELLEEQRLSWKLLDDNMKSLGATRIKEFSFSHFSFKVQFNPERIVSSGAKVDKATISNRRCFLCKENRPSEQKEIIFQEDYEILCNPFPIFNQHFTISHLNHIPQEINHSFPVMLDLSKELNHSVVFYNAPNCGASAPDHLHFQAGNLDFLPIPNELDQLKNHYGESLSDNEDVMITAIDDGLRKFIVLESDSKSEIIKAFNKIYKQSELFSGDEPPMLNILAYYQQAWKILIFLREKHRPWQYFAEGEENILFSPASVDMGGALILPLEKDFNKIESRDIEIMFKEIMISSEKFAVYKELFKSDKK